MGTYLSTKKGRHVKPDKQGGGWKGYEYVRGSPGSMESWNWKNEGAKTTLKAQRGKLTKAAQECAGTKGSGAFRVCVREKMKGG